ncbi:MAG: cbb3-type cytochrome oxidase assembly protein CcoS [Calditrichaeota bacterium]|nr:MAG: cbb3-type cytochrome oxidase assembly protein CcoS [Calditrichota bacterium]
MSVLYLLVAVSLLLAAGFLVAFIWAMKSGQFDDPYTPSVRILTDEDKFNSPTKEEE